MTRLARFAGYTAATGSAYALVALDVLAIPLVSKSTSDALTPVVRPRFIYLLYMYEWKG